MRGASAATILLTMLVCTIGALLAGPMGVRDVEVYPQMKRMAMPTGDAAASTSEQATAEQTSSLHWELPPRWRAVEPPQDGLARLGHFLVDLPGGPAQCTVMMVSNSPGMIAGNVQRWQRQLGLPASEITWQEESSALGPVPWASLVAADGSQAFLVSLVDRGAGLLSVKMVCTGAQLAAAEPGFRVFLASLLEAE